MYDDAQNNHNDPIYKLLEVNKRTAIKVFNLLKRLKGMNCVVKTPITKGSIFGLEDIVEYDDIDTYEVKLLIFNLFQEGSIGMDNFDTFLDCYALTEYDKALPLQSLVYIEFYGRQMVMKVDDHRNVTPSIHEQLFVKNILVPAT
jgi:hypothetical protein